MLTMELTRQEAAFLSEQLSRQAQHVEDELVHTDARDMQAELARDLELLQMLRDRRARVVAAARVTAP